MSSQGRAIERSKMRKRLAVSALVATALFASSNSAGADAQSDYQLALAQYKTELANWNISVKAEQENFRLAMKNWNLAVKNAEQARKEIAGHRCAIEHTVGLRDLRSLSHIGIVFTDKHIACTAVQSHQHRDDAS